MKIFRRAQKRTLLIWIAVLSLAILCAQGLKLHVHGFDHGGANHHEQLALDKGGHPDHAHQNGVHFANDESHGDHHDNAVQELDFSPDGVLKKVSGSIATLALLAAMLILFLPRPAGQANRLRRDSTLPLPKLYFHTPPLRAPPR